MVEKEEPNSEKFRTYFNFGKEPDKIALSAILPGFCLLFNPLK